MVSACAPKVSPSCMANWAAIYSEPTIAALVGHKGYTITSRYVDSADAVLLAVAARCTAELMGDHRDGVVVLLTSVQAA